MNPFAVFHPNKDYTEFVESRIKWMTTSASDLMHGAVGLCGEVIELRFHSDEANMLEEMGDVEFYFEHTALAFDRMTDFTRGSVPFQAIEMSYGTAQTQLLRCSGDVLDYAKKIWVYNKSAYDLQREMLDALLMVRMAMDSMYRLLGYTRKQVQDANMAKLKKRYPTGYSDQAAQARADKIAG